MIVFHVIFWGLAVAGLAVLSNLLASLAGLTGLTGLTFTCGTPSFRRVLLLLDPVVYARVCWLICSVVHTAALIAFDCVN